MAQVAVETEISPYDDVLSTMSLTFSSEESRIANATYDFARELSAKAVIIFSESGYTARLLSHFRPEQTILVVTNKIKTYNQLALVWGVQSFLCDGQESRNKCIETSIEQARSRGFLHAQDLVITVLGSTKTGKKLILTGSRIA
jgi:pyruvate kinase